MTADAALPASDDLTPEVLARWEELAAPFSSAECYWCGATARGVASKDDHGIMRRQSCGGHGNGFRLFMASVPAEDARALLSGVRSRDARIAELEGVIARALAEADDWSKSPPGESAPTRAVGDLFADILRPGASNG